MTIPGGQTATWGVMCATDDCERAGDGHVGNRPARVRAAPRIASTSSGARPAAGLTARNRSWSPTDEDIVWGSSDNSEDTVVWGTSDDNEDTVVWGTSDENEDTVVWGTSAPGDVVWDCNEPSCGGGN